MQHTTPCPFQCEVLKKQILCTAVLSALALMSGAASAAEAPKYDDTITDQSGLTSLGLDGTKSEKISIDVGNKTAINPSTSLNAIGNKNAVVIKGKDIVTVNASNKVEKTFNFVKMSDLTLEATHNGIYLDSTLTGVHIGRQGIKPQSIGRAEMTGEEDPLNNVTITAGSGNAIYVKTGDWAVGTPNFDDEDYIDDPNGRGSVSILAKNTKLVSTNDSAIYIEGKWNSTVNKFETHPDVEISDIKNTYQTLMLSGKNYSIEASKGASLTVRNEEVHLDGGIHVSKNAWVDLGFRDKDRFPNQWEDGFNDAEEDAEILDKVTVTAKGGKAALEFDNGGLLSIGANTVTINADKGTAISVQTTGDQYESDDSVVDVYAYDKLVINGDIKVDTTEGIGKEGYINISAGDKDHVGTVIINGDIDLKTTKENAQAVNIILEGANSSFTGKINTTIVDKSPSTFALFASKDANDAPKGTNVAIRNGATLNATGDSSITNIDADGGVIIVSDNSTLMISKIHSDKGGTIFLVTDVNSRIRAGEGSGDGQWLLKVTDHNSDGNPEDLKEIFQADKYFGSKGVNIHFENATGDSEFTQDLSNNQITVTKTKISDVLLSLNDIASNQMLAWRAQINDVSKRMGDLRTYDTESGGWVRMFGSRSKYGDRNMDNKSTTIQVGTDRRVAGNGYVGLTAHYSEGDGDLVNGSTENKAFGFGIYGGWMADDGQFIDVILKRTRMDTDFDLRYNSGIESKGDFQTWGTSLAMEYGWRLECEKMPFWLEPQAEVTYGHLEGVDYTTSAGVNAHQKGMDSLVGRLGLALGYTKDANTVYAKASVAHEFEGESSASMRSINSVTLEQDIGGTWGEVALGGTVRLNKSIAAYGEFQTAFGSPVKTPYQWNIGMRYMW